MGLELNFSAQKASDQLKQFKKDLDSTKADIPKLVKQIESIVKATDSMSKAFSKSGNTKASEEFKKISKEADGVVKSIKNTHLEMGVLSKVTSDVTKKSKEEAVAHDKLAKKIEQQAKQITSAVSRSEKYIKTNTTLKKTLDESKKSVRNLTQENKKNENELLRTYGANYKLEKKAGDLVKRNKELATSNKSLGGTVSYLNREIKNLEKDIHKLKIANVKYGKANIDLQRRVSRLTSELNKSKKAYQGAYKTAKSYDKQLASAIGTIDRYEKKIAKLNARIDKMKKKNTEAANSINKVMKAASTVRNLLFLSTMAYSIQRLSNTIIKLGSDFEKTMTIVGAVTQNIGKGFQTTGYDDLINKALELGATTEYTSNQSAEAMKNLGLAGFNTRQIIATVPGVLDLATAGQVDLATASELTVQALTAMGLKTADTAKLTENMTRINDAFIATTTRTNTTVESIAESFKYVGQVAKNTGMEIEDLTNYIGMLGSSGVQGCYDDQTEVLTIDGWKKWEDVTEDDIFATINPETNALEYQKSTSLIKYHYSGQMYRVENTTLDVLVTPNHKMYIKKKRRDKFELIRADEVHGRVGHSYLKSAYHFEGHSNKICIPGVNKNFGNYSKNEDDIFIDQDIMAEFLGYFLSEGCTDREGNRNNHGKPRYRVGIAQLKSESKDKIREFLKGFPFQSTETKNGFEINSKQLWNYCVQFGKAQDKFIPTDVKNMKKENLIILMRALILGDGSVFNSTSKKCFGYYTSSKRLKDDIEEICFKIGASSHSKVRREKGWKTKIKGCETRANFDCHEMVIVFDRHEVTFEKTDYTGAHKKRLKGEKSKTFGESWVDYDGFVYCAEVPPNHVLVVKRNGKCYASGNSMAGTQLAFALSKQFKAAQALGLNPELASFRDVLEEINKQGWDFNDIYKIFIQRGSRAVLALKDMLPVMDRLNKLQKESSLSAKELADIYRDTVSVNIQKVKSLLENIGINGFRLESKNLNDSLKKFYKVLSDNQDNLEEFASFFVKMTSKIIDFGSSLVKAMPKLTKFYKENKAGIEVLTASLGILLIGKGGIDKVLSLLSKSESKGFSSTAKGVTALALSVASMNFELSKESQIEIITDRIKKLNDELKKTEEIGTIEKDIYINVGTAGEVFAGVEMVDASDEIKNIKKRIKDRQDQVNKLQEEIRIEQADPDFQRRQSEEIRKNRQTIIAEYTTQIAQDIKAAQDEASKASGKLRKIQEDFIEIIGIGRSDKGDLLGGKTFEDEISKISTDSRKKIENEIDNLNKLKADLKKFEESKKSSQSELLKFDSEPEGAGKAFDEYTSVISKIEAQSVNIKNINDAIKSQQEVIKREQELLDKKKQISGFKIDQRELSRITQAENQIIQAEKKNYNTRKNLYNDFIKYKSSAFEKYIAKDIQDQIDAEKRSFQVFKDKQEYLPSGQRLNTSEMNKLQKEMEAYFSNLEEYKTSQVSLGIVERKSAEINAEKEILQRKYDLISGFSRKTNLLKKNNLQEQMKLELQVYDEMIASQKKLMEGINSNAQIPAGLKISEGEMTEFLKSTDEERETLVREWIRRIADATEFTKENIIEQFESIGQSVAGDIFSDAIKGDLQNAEEYFSSFVDSLISMWSQMAAQMLIMGKTIQGLSMAGSIGMMGAAGVALYGISSVISRAEERSAEKKRKKDLRKQLKTQLGDSLAQLELGDTGYQIYQLNAKIKELSDQARDAGYPMAEIIKLRKLETKAILDGVKAKYQSVITGINDWVTGIQRENWSVDDWKSEYDRLHDDLLNLDQSSNTYQDDSINIIEKSLEALQEIYEIQKSQLNALESLDQSLGSQIWDLRNTGPVPTSLSSYQSQYDNLLVSAQTTEGGFINEDAVQEFQNFVSSYIDAFASAGINYNELLYGSNYGVVNDLDAIQGDVQSEMDRLTDAIKFNSGELGANSTGLGDVELAIKRLTDITEEIAFKEVYKMWMEARPELIETPGYSNLQDVNKERAISGGFTGGADASFTSGDLAFLSNDGWSTNNISSVELGALSQAQLFVNYLISNMESWLGWINSGVLSGSVTPSQNEAWLEFLEKIPIGEVHKSLTGEDGGFKNFNDWRETSAEDKNMLYQDLAELMGTDKPIDFPLFAQGGWSNQPAIFGETGYGEYAVPDANNPNNSHFLKSVGVDSNEIGKAIGEIVASRMQENSGGDIVVQLNGKEIARATVEEIKRTPSYRTILNKRV